ncbi:MAG: Nuclease [Pedosphaera sp.]|nr:Nuclease [Pedosphaera sp.]
MTCKSGPKMQEYARKIRTKSSNCINQQRTFLTFIQRTPVTLTIRKSRLFNSFSVLLCATALFLTTRHAGARIIGISFQMQLGNPSNATADTNNHNHYLIQRTVEAIDFNDNLGEPNWASWDLTASDVGSSGRSSSFFADTNLPPNFTEVLPGDYSGSGFDRGHMCPSADRTDNTTDNDLVFFMSNIIPQASVNNQTVWANFETYCRTLAQSGNELLITCGPSLFDGSRIQPGGKAAIPQFTWKIAVVVPPGTNGALNRITTATRVITLKIPNNDSVSSTWQNYLTSAAQIEIDTGFTFFTALPTNVAAALRSKVDGQTNPPPTIFSFSPASGSVNDSVVITGTNLFSAGTVAFNGTSAEFTVNSDTQITAVVPTNAFTGLISITTASGTAASSSSFTVIGPSIPDLGIAATHVGSFTQGDANDTYTIIVTNLGSATTSGTITLTDSLPASLTATAIGGSGWTANLATLTCSRSDTLAAGSSYPPITLTVAVATNAPSTVTNFATVSGGGDMNSANNSSADPTTIIQPGVVPFTGVLAGWDTSGQTNFGVSPLAATTNAPNLTIVGLTRKAGVATSGSGAARGWGGTGFTDSSESAAVTASRAVTVSIAANTGYMVSYSAISKFDYRRSGTGPSNGVVQYQIGSGAFTDIATVSYSSTSSGGASLGPIDLSGIPALKNIGEGTNVTFRIVNWGGTSSGGTWYIYDMSSSSAPDLAIQGTLTPVATAVADLAVSTSHGSNFVQGDIGDTYTITVANVATAGTTGTVSVTDTLPPGLTATSIGGPGWTPNLGTLTCTRSDILPAGSSYPPITLTVNVATNAPATVTNLVSVTGGGEANTANNTANDPTSIIALTPIQSWRLFYFGTTANGGAAADTAIATADGMPNLLKYALGLVPLTPAANPVVGDLTTGFLRLTLPKNPNASDISLHVEATTNLTTPSWTTSTTTVDQNTPTLLQVHYNAPVNSSASGFIRLRVSRP